MTLPVVNFGPGLGERPNSSARLGETVQAATSLDEVLHLVPEEYAAFMVDLSLEVRAEGLRSWKEDVRKTRPTAERVARAEAAVLLSEPSPPDRPGVKLMRTSRVDGRWQHSGDVFLMSAIPGAQGEFRVSGSVAAELSDGMVSMSAINGIPLIVVADLLSDSLDEDADVAKVQVPFPPEHMDRCFEPGAMEAGAIGTGGDYGVTLPAGFWPEGAGEDEESKQEARGTLEITRVNGLRFSGSVELMAADASGQPLRSPAVWNGC